MRGALMVCGTASDVGKSHVVAGLCRALHRRGVRVAPFKAQNMSLNSYVTSGGDEIGRAQAAQAFAAGLEPEVAMNPVLLKPTSETQCQVVVMGKPVGTVSAADYHDDKPNLLALVLGALADLRARYDVVILEGAGSAAEINLLDRDIVNLPIATAAGIKAIVVGDIDRGGVFAALLGTVSLLPADQRACVAGFVINKLRGDPTLLLDGAEQLERHTGVPMLGVLPYIGGVSLDAEDSLAFQGPPPTPATAAPTVLDVAAIRFPQVANATDLDPLAIEPGIGVRWVDHAAAFGRPDLVVLPGSKATIGDLAWLRASGIASAIAESDAVILGICAGYQMLGGAIEDPCGVEAPAGTSVDGLHLLDATTTFARDKTLAQTRGEVWGLPTTGYEIHHGRTTGASSGGAVVGTNLHGLFENDEFRRAFLVRLASRRGKTFSPAATSFEAARQAQYDTLGDLVEAHLDLDALTRIIEAAA